MRELNVEARNVHLHRLFIGRGRLSARWQEQCECSFSRAWPMLSVLSFFSQKRYMMNKICINIWIYLKTYTKTSIFACVLKMYFEFYDVLFHSSWLWRKKSSSFTLSPVFRVKFNNEASIVSRICCTCSLQHFCFYMVFLLFFDISFLPLQPSFASSSFFFSAIALHRLTMSPASHLITSTAAFASTSFPDIKHCEWLPFSLLQYLYLSRQSSSENGVPIPAQAFIISWLDLWK